MHLFCAACFNEFPDNGPTSTESNIFAESGARQLGPDLPLLLLAQSRCLMKDKTFLICVVDETDSSSTFVSLN